MLSVFYRSIRNTPPDHRVRSSTIAEEAEITQYDEDIVIYIVQALDDHLCGLRTDKIKRDAAKHD